MVTPYFINSFVHLCCNLHWVSFRLVSPAVYWWCDSNWCIKDTEYNWFSWRSLWWFSGWSTAVSQVTIIKWCSCLVLCHWCHGQVNITRCEHRKQVSPDPLVPIEMDKEGAVDCGAATHLEYINRGGLTRPSECTVKDPLCCQHVGEFWRIK